MCLGISILTENMNYLFFILIFKSPYNKELKIDLYLIDSKKINAGCTTTLLEDASIQLRAFLAIWFLRRRFLKINFIH